MRKIFTLIAAVMLSAAASAADKIVLDLNFVASGNPSTADDWNSSWATDYTNIKADDSNWVQDGTTERYWTDASYTSSTPVALEANGVQLNFTKGLLFKWSGNGTIRLDPNPTRGLTINNKNGTIIIPNLKAGDKIKFSTRTGKNGDERSWTVVNATVKTGTLTSSTGVFAMAELEVTADGDVTFTPSNGMSVDYILVMRPTTGIQNIDAADAEVSADAKEVNLLGQPVGENYKGVVIVDGKKFVRK